jgi:hypothetical protein
MRIKILPNGDLKMLYTDAIPLHAIGRVTVQRASEVEYDHARSGWTVKLLSGGWIGDGEQRVEDAGASTPFRSRAAALAAEVRYLEARL